MKKILKGKKYHILNASGISNFYSGCLSVTLWFTTYSVCLSAVIYNLFCR